MLFPGALNRNRLNPTSESANLTGLRYPPVMALATMTITPGVSYVQGGAATTFTVVADGVLAQINGQSYGWQNTNGCTELPGSVLQDSAAGPDGFGVSGATMASGQIAEGDGYAEFIAAVPFANPTIGYPEFGGRAFFAGLTRADACTDRADFDYAIEVGQGGVSIYEAGVLKATPRAPRNNGRYRVAIESGMVVYRADDQVIYRSDLAPEYPLRLGAIFYNRLVDQIGGVASQAIGLSAYDSSGNAAGSWTGLTEWTAPNTRGRYRIVAQGADYLFGEAYVFVSEVFPNPQNTNGWPLPYVFRRVRSVDDWKVIRQPLDDQAAFYGVPVPTAEPIRRWQIEWRNMQREFAEILDDFIDRHFGRGYSFYLWEPDPNGGPGTTWDNCRIERYEDSLKKDWNRPRKLTIVREPV